MALDWRIGWGAGAGSKSGAGAGAGRISGGGASSLSSIRLIGLIGLIGSIGSIGLITFGASSDNGSTRTARGGKESPTPMAAAAIKIIKIILTKAG